MNLFLRAGFLILAFGVIGNIWGASDQPRLGLPIACAIGKECFIQNYVDHDLGSEYKDFRCGHLSYDGHKGTDFRLKTQADIRLGVPILAAEGGKVIGVRDGEPDIAVSVRGKENLHGRDAGNGVVIDHGAGWITQYSHLRQGSVNVQQGQIVKKGQILGMVGESGNADFPHVDFSVRHNDQIVDPFRPYDLGTCSSEQGFATLWDESAAKSLSYQATGILASGFSFSIPSRLEVDQGLDAVNINTNDPALIFWVEVFGVNHGDRWMIKIYDPSGKELVQSNQMQQGNKAVVIFAAGINNAQSSLLLGLYRAQFRLFRGGKLLLEQHDQTQVDIK